MFWGAATLGSFRTTGYRPLHDRIGVMAAVGANRAGLAMGGLLMLAIAIGALARVLYTQRTTFGGDERVGKLAGLAAIGVLGAAVFPCDDGCPGPFSGTFANLLHMMFLAIGYATLLGATALAYRGLRSQPRERVVRTITLLALTLAVPMLLATVALLPDRSVIGLTERLFLVAETAWLGILALRYM
jgi:Protein of unknown function (DUF998)